MSNARFELVGAAFAEALDRRIDDARVELGHLLVGEAQLLDYARSEILGEDVGLLDEVAQHLLAARILEIERDGALVGVQQHEIVAVGILAFRRCAAALLTALGIFNLHDVGAEPGERLCDRRAGFKLRKIDDFDAGKGRLAAGGATHLRILHVEPGAEHALGRAEFAL